MEKSSTRHEVQLNGSTLFNTLESDLPAHREGRINRLKLFEAHTT